MKIRGLFLIFISLAVSFFQCGLKEDQNSNIIAGNLKFSPSSDGEKQFKILLAKPNFKKIFKTDINNIYYTKHSWTGRVRVNEASFQSLFTVNDFTTTWEGTIKDTRGLVFSIFHPDGSDLTYKIYLEWNDNKKMLFSRRFSQKKFYDGFISFAESMKGKVKLVFETRGKGAGAWISPRLDQPDAKSNLVIIVVMDTLRYDHTSLYGYSRRTTPNLGGLAKDGIKFNNAYSTSSWTLPAHVSLFSGRDLSEHGVIGPQNTIPLRFPLLAEVFQKKGYVTAAFTGGGFIEDSYGFHRGFQYYSNKPGNVFSINSAERVFTHFKNYVEKYKDNDLFIFLHTYQIHAPYKAPGKFIKSINPALEKNLLGISNFLKTKKEYFKPVSKTTRQLLIDLYDASILYTDEALLGNMISFLKERGDYEKSLLVVLSDHGEEFYDHGSWEHGHTLYNELVKIPLVIKFPKGSISESQLPDSLTSISDIPGIVLKNCLLLKAVEKEFPLHTKQAERLLPILFPVSPTIKAFPTRISFVDNNFSFIFNQINNKQFQFFDPPPSVTPESYELYKRSDVAQVNNISDQQSSVLEKYRKKIREYIDKLNKIKKLPGNFYAGKRDFNPDTSG